MNRRGYIGNIAFVIAILFVLAITVFVMSKIFNSYNTQWQANPSIDNDSKELVQSNVDRYAPVWDGTFIFVFVLLAVFIVLSVSSLASRPEFFFVVVILLVFVVGGAGLVSNAFTSVSNSTEFTNQTEDFTYTNFIMNNLATLTLLLGVILVIGLFMRVRGII